MGMTIKEALKNAKPALEKKISNALNTEVAEAVKNREADVIVDVVYAALTPVDYERRGDGGGLGDIGNITHTVDGNKLIVSNETPPNPYLNGLNPSGGMTTTTKPIAALIEKGIHASDGYGYDYAHVEPRPFTEETIESLKDDRAHVSALKKGLRRQGLKVK